MNKNDIQIKVPFQVETLITSLRDRSERVHIRGNYRQRLDDIRQAIDKALADYDTEMGTAAPRKKGQK